MSNEPSAFASPRWKSVGVVAGGPALRGRLEEIVARARAAMRKRRRGGVILGLEWCVDAGSGIASEEYGDENLGYGSRFFVTALPGASVAIGSLAKHPFASAQNVSSVAT
jgi:hypothetical protein